ncbi:hypothetical protein [Chenggangzhangella methanolivorans]|uniref:Uncharacterized protein n=1 Tax=Chenggangzhangella methanolivorans TaxID=1437009 RepID=A0A9E6RCY4_9HYPH|nr:hypothetical protein [Chenggangzhangella methanolivorans]QZO02558.1 hypothetical protein K6K41_20505 [Chenggangzhangella methanolivorans]
MISIVTTDFIHRTEAEGALAVTAIAGVLFGGEKAPDEKPKNDEKSGEADKTGDKDEALDEELDESFPASDPPASTQP